jgi:hypothetical protein
MCGLKILSTHSHCRSDAMNFEQELKRVADTYSRQGYQVTLRPGPEDLPHFARDFKVELVGRRGTEGVLVSVKKNREELEADANLSRYAEVIGTQSEWRFDVAVLESEGSMGRNGRAGLEFSGDDIKGVLTDAEHLVGTGFLRPAVITAWAGFEAAMRMRLRAAGGKAGWGSSPRTLLNELYSSGVLSVSEFRQLEKLSDLRNQIVHGFSSPDIDKGIVAFLTATARRLIEESKPAKQPA